GRDGIDEAIDPPGDPSGDRDPGAASVMAHPVELQIAVGLRPPRAVRNDLVRGQPGGPVDAVVEHRLRIPGMKGPHAGSAISMDQELTVRLLPAVSTCGLQVVT